MAIYTTRPASNNRHSTKGTGKSKGSAFTVTRTGSGAASAGKAKASRSNVRKAPSRSGGCSGCRK